MEADKRKLCYKHVKFGNMLSPQLCFRNGDDVQRIFSVLIEMQKI